MTTGWIGRVLGATAIGVVLAGGLSACQVTTSYGVTSTVDVPDAAVGDGVCASSSNGCTLRAAVQEADAHAGPIEVALAQGATYDLTIAGRDENASATGDLDVTGQITIVGHGAFIDANGLDRVLHVRNGGSLTARDVTLTGGTAGSGGGLRIDWGGTARISTSTITGNVADGFKRCWADTFGLGLGGCSDEYTAVDNPFYSHTGDGGGAGIWNRGDLSVWDSTISGNVIPESAAVSGCWTFIHAIICDGRDGGGVFNTGNAALVNDTISGNVVNRAFGAAIATADFPTTLMYVTIADNTQLAPDTWTAAIGFATSGRSIAGAPIVGATVIDGVGPLCATGLSGVSLGYNLSSDNTCFSSGGTDRSSTPAGLGPLTANGGPTSTHAPLDGSALSDSIPADVDLCRGVIRSDQRGADRRIGFPCTVGSVEAFEP